MSNLRDIRCPRCKCYRKQEDFISKERVVKSCVKCREVQKKYADKNRGKEKEYRNDNADKLKHLYQANRDKQKKENPLHIKVKYMVCDSKRNDKNRNRTYEENDYITRSFLKEMWVKQNGVCYYKDCECKLLLEFNKDCRNPNQISIQRLDNNIAHIQSNCVLSCFNCNVKRKETIISQ